MEQEYGGRASVLLVRQPAACQASSNSILYRCIGRGSGVGRDLGAGVDLGIGVGVGVTAGPVCTSKDPMSIRLASAVVPNLGPGSPTGLLLWLDLVGPEKLPSGYRVDCD